MADVCGFSIWGNSLSYVSSDGSRCASSPTILRDGRIKDGDEIAIYSNEKCDDSCGAIRPGSVAYSKLMASSREW